MRKVIGIDIDGVLARFAPAYQRLVVKLTGEDKFAPGDIDNPPCWNWPEYRGYTKAQVSEVWAYIKQSESFWTNLEPYEANVAALRTFAWEFADQHDVYFITTRLGVDVKAQTEFWLKKHVGEVWDRHTTLIVGHRMKGHAAKALQLDAYVDDNYDNVGDCIVASPETHTYLVDWAYNKIPKTEYSFASAIEYRRIPDLQTFFRREGLYMEDEDAEVPTRILTV